MTDPFQSRKPDFEKLRACGFQESEAGFSFQTELLDGQFTLTVKISRAGEVRTELVEKDFGEAYTLHLVEEAGGSFVAKVREEYSRALSAIAEHCFEPNVFSSRQTNALIAHAREKYGTEPEYLWEKFPDNAVLRRGDNGKWYGAILTTGRKSLGLEGEEKIEILDIRCDPVALPLIVDGKRVFPGWHMNKKHWITVLLDGTLAFDEVCELLEESWQLAGKK